MYIFEGASQKALKALKDLETKAINRNCIGRRLDQVKIACLNVQNLIHHIEDVKQHPKILEHDMIFLSETWLSDIHTSADSNPYQINGYNAHYINVENGKGLAAFNEPNFEFVQSSSCSSFQIIKFSTSFVHHTGITVPIDVISLYRSKLCPKDEELLSILKNMVQYDKVCIIVGDINLPFQTESRHFLISEILKMNFNQLIDQPTHHDGGIIDYLFLYRPTFFKEVIISYELFCPFYSDHFGISISLNKQDNPFLMMESTVPDHLLVESTCHKSSSGSVASQMKGESTP